MDQDRRSFFRNATALATAVGVVALSPITKLFAQPEREIPRKLDVRKDENFFGTKDWDIVFRRYGRELKSGVVAYDLDQDWITVYREDPDGHIVLAHGEALYATMHGGVTVEWRRKPRKPASVSYRKDPLTESVIFSNTSSGPDGITITRTP
jgi:hypothetical protein